MAISLGNCWPNPFNPRTTISYNLPVTSRISLRIFDISGRLVKTLLNGEMVEAGGKEIVWRGRDNSGRQAASGTYFYRLDVG